LDFDVLNALYIGLGGPDWTNSDGWLENNDVCSWYGITCSEIEDSIDRVTNITLSKNNLVGTVISEIWELPFLSELDLRSNNISVSFEGILNAKKLETLYLSSTNLKSLDGIGRAVALKNLHLTDNGLTGTFPNELYNLLFLEKLYLNFNRFTGPLSPGIAMMNSLKELFVFHNSLTGSIPSELAKLPNIEVIALGENEFSGNVPQEMNSMSSLKILSLQRETGLSVKGEGLNGPLPAFDGLPNLEELYVGGNEFTGTIPSSFIGGVANKSATVIVDLSSNQLEGSIPPSLANFDDLVLYVAGNMIDAVPDSICAKHSWMNGEVAVNCDALLCPPGSFNQYGRRVGEDGPCENCGYLGSTLYYGSTTCEAVDVAGLDDRGILRQFYEVTGGADWYKKDYWDADDIDICAWYGVKCAIINGEETVTELILANNGLVGTVPPIVFHLPALKVLNLRNNSIDFTFQGIRFATKLENLHLDATKVTTLAGVGMAKALKVLHVQQNEFGGLTIPEEIFGLISLESLLLSSSGFEGTISTRIGNLVNLEVLNVHGNDFSGEIPSEIGSLTKLEVLALGENNFFGTLPPTLNQLTSLESISLDQFTRNNAGVSGPLLAFSGLKKIREFYFGSNSLTGTIPEDFLAGAAIDAKNDTINVVLKANSLTGTLPASLSRFSKLDIDITENKIEAIDDSLCSMGDWMNGAVGSFQCKAILCPVGTFNLEGRQASSADECQPCTDDDVSPYLGSTSCTTVQKLQERDILEILFLTTDGNNWKQKGGWMDKDVDICDWYGISCRSNSTVESILLGSNNLVGTPPQGLFQLPNLRFLWLYSNPINFSFKGIERATSLISLLLDSTGLTSLQGIGSAPSLVDVDVRFNDLGGPLPSEIRNLHNLQSFSCSNNRFTGSIPSFSTNRQLVTLRLGGNLFAGGLPSFSTNRDIIALDVSGNQLTGTIPATLLQAADKTDAIFIDLSSNQLTGTVPGELASFDDLTLYLRDNKLEGINPKLCGSSSWNDGDVGKFQCDGILCSPNSYSPSLGRATQDGVGCLDCDKAVYFGSSHCGAPPDSASSGQSIGFVLLAMLTLPLYLVI
jgi:Leucine-rich repeat (LRR) protein